MHKLDHQQSMATVANKAADAVKPHRYENIDALRAIAALAVVVQHFFGDVIREATDRDGQVYHLAVSAVSVFDAGRFGVALFFLISGFVVPFSIKGTDPIRRFAISRFFRLFPALWLALLCLGIANSFHGHIPSVPQFLANMTMLPAAFGQQWMSGAYWTLTIEILFYVLSAGLFLVGRLYRPGAVAFFAIVLAAATALPILIRSFGLPVPVQYISLHLSFLYLGLLLRMALVDRRKGAFAASVVVLLVQAVVLLSIGEFSLERRDGFFLVGTVPILTSYLVALCVFVFSVKTRLPDNAVLSWLGALSYSIYLFHGVAALIVFAWLPLSGTWTDLPIGLASLVLTLGLSLLTYEYLEKPMINLGYRFIKRKSATDSKVLV